MTEAMLSRQIVDEATIAGWVVHYIPDRILKAWGAKIRAGLVGMADPGFPDLVIARADATVFFVELKSETGELRESQAMWRDMLLGLGFEWHCWRPRHWEDVIVPRLAGVAFPPACEGMEGELWPERLLESISSAPGARKNSSRRAMRISYDEATGRLLDGPTKRTDLPIPPIPFPVQRRTPSLPNTLEPS